MRMLLVVFLGMMGASALIGDITHTTVSQVYEEISAEGLTTAPNPFDHVSVLFYARNAVIYVALIGALLALVMGAFAGLRDRKSGTAGLVLSRPTSARVRVAGQFMGIAALLAAVVSLSGVLLWVMMSVIVTSPLGLASTARLAGFVGLSWVVMLILVLLGMVAGLRSRREASAILVPCVVWSVIAFVVPQIGTAARPVSLLNPVPAEATPGFDALAGIMGPLSVTEQFKRVAAQLLDDATVQGGIGPALAAIGATFALVAALLWLTPRPVYLRGVHE